MVELVQSSANLTTILTERSLIKISRLDDLFISVVYNLTTIWK